eukprot:SAG11_NODE_6361_length_1329_cov_0.747154_2_plen_140_part_00
MEPPGRTLDAALLPRRFLLDGEKMGPSLNAQAAPCTVLGLTCEEQANLWPTACVLTGLLADPRGCRCQRCEGLACLGTLSRRTWLLAWRHDRRRASRQDLAEAHRTWLCGHKWRGWSVAGRAGKGEFSCVELSHEVCEF